MDRPDKGGLTHPGRFAMIESQSWRKVLPKKKKIIKKKKFEAEQCGEKNQQSAGRKKTVLRGMTTISHGREKPVPGALHPGKSVRILIAK